MELNVFTRNNCSHCEKLELPSNLIINKINIDEGYGGFRPPNVPVLQVGGLNLEGPEVINIILKAIADDDNKV